MSCASSPPPWATSSSRRTTRTARSMLYALSSLPSISPPPPPCSLPWVFEAYPSSAYCVDTGPYLGLCAGRSQQKNHHSAHSHSTSQATAPSTTTATTHPRTQFPNPPPRDAVWVVGSGIPGEQTLTKDVLGSAADWHTLTKLDILRKERLDPSERPAATPGGAEENSRHIAETRDHPYCFLRVGPNSINPSSALRRQSRCSLHAVRSGKPQRHLLALEVFDEMPKQV
jgi:hypothetical protein